jgi:hypothetical protein
MHHVTGHWVTLSFRQLSTAVNAAVFLILTCCYSTMDRQPGGVDAYRDGASWSACRTLKPDHQFEPQDPSVVKNPYRLEVVDGVTEFEPGQLIRRT